MALQAFPLHSKHASKLKTFTGDVVSSRRLLSSLENGCRNFKTRTTSKCIKLLQLCPKRYSYIPESVMEDSVAGLGFCRFTDRVAPNIYRTPRFREQVRDADNSRCPAVSLSSRESCNSIKKRMIHILAPSVPAGDADPSVARWQRAGPSSPACQSGIGEDEDGLW